MIPPLPSPIYEEISQLHHQNEVGLVDVFVMYFTRSLLHEYLFFFFFFLCRTQRLRMDACVTTQRVAMYGMSQLGN